MKPKHLASNLTMIALAAFTLFFAALSPPWTAASAAEAESLLLISNSNSTEALTDPHGAYRSLRPYVESRGGKVVYNPENDTVDVKMNDSSFSLLLQDHLIRCNGRELPGLFYVRNGETFMDTSWIDILTESHS
ncbi:hypothetical protein [Paenibacillus sp. HB172176]|uniref:hypothetical protein n=1 Tax=Paenibacillus sp. HB172176 TaxID=2493690 RepID=UPI00143C7E02|nr:hypothetical protein [Paenibacillus sp. HB172176]